MCADAIISDWVQSVVKVEDANETGDIDSMTSATDDLCAKESALIENGIKSIDMFYRLHDVIGAKAEDYV